MDFLMDFDVFQARILEGVITAGLISFMVKRRSKSFRDSRTGPVSW
jgi:ABC-type Co2+ transport system permease subunit